MEIKMATVNGINIAYHDSGGTGEALILAHGLTANMHSFAGLMRAGLAQNLRVILLDLRGRGQSDKPASGYHMADHARDVIGLMDYLGLEQVVMGGHSFGGLLSMYMGAYYPERLKRIVVIDAGKEATHPSVLPKIKPSLDRLGRTLPSEEAYIDAVKQSPYYADGFWDEDLEAYYRADLKTLPNGEVCSCISAKAIEEAVTKIIALDWGRVIQLVQPPAILIHAPAPFGAPDAPPVLTDDGVQETIDLLPDVRYVRVGGHHITMLFGPHAPQVVKAILDFIPSV